MLEKILLFPYYLVLKLRHSLYDSGIWKVHTSSIPTICVGNIAAGGTGKTPHTEMILRTLLSDPEWKDKQIAVLSRGHKRVSGGFQQVPLEGTDASYYGDEPLQIKKKFPGVTVAVDRNRVEGCAYLKNPETLELSRRGRKCHHKDMKPAELVVLDDSFQYRSLKAYFNIVLVDYSRPVSKDSLLPFGRLRDLPERLHYADVILVTKCPLYLTDWDKIEWVKSMGVLDYNPVTCKGTDRKGKQTTIIFTTVKYRGLKPVYPEGDQHYVYSHNLILFSGIAKDTPLRRFLCDNYNIVRHFKFNDHHKYTSLDIRTINRAANHFPTAIVTTTEKDAQRLHGKLRIPDQLKQRMFYAPIEVDFLSDNERDIFRNVLISSLRGFRPEPGQTPRG